MKKSEFIQLIREEIKTVLNEGKGEIGVKKLEKYVKGRLSKYAKYMKFEKDLVYYRKDKVKEIDQKTLKFEEREGLLWSSQVEPADPNYPKVVKIDGKDWLVRKMAGDVWN